MPSNAEHPPFLSTALAYARRGWYVFPCQPGSKAPGTPHGFKDASVDPEVIETWWTNCPDANIGIACGPSGLVVVDVDTKDGAPGLESWHELRAELGIPDDAPTVETPTGGLHAYYGAPEGGPIRNSAGRLGEGIDVRAEGGYVIAAPSIHPNGGAYGWALGASPDDVPLQVLPLALVERLRSVSRSATPAGPGAPNEPIPDGQRNATLASLAGSMRKRGMTPEAIEAALLAENAARCDPPLEEGEVKQIAASIGRYAPAVDPPACEHLTQLGNARRLVNAHGADIRWCEPMGGWFIWDGRHWALDEVGEIYRRAKDTVLAIYREAADEPDDEQRKAIVGWAARSESAHNIEAMIRLARSEPGIPLRPEAFDADPWALNCENGVIDLRTGQLRPHRREDLFTKLCPVAYDPSARDPIFDRYLADATGGDVDFASYLQRACGYMLTGDTSEEAFFLLLGRAGTGKSTVVEALLATMGDYAAKASFDSFLEQRNVGQARPDLARLRGARLVAAVEASPKRRLAEPMLKELTGGDTVSVRHLYREPFEFRPVCKVVLAANEPPRISDTDSGIWRRLQRVPFEREVPEDRRDPEVKRHLTTEGRGALLAWAVAGCLQWQREGLQPCAIVRERTAALRAEMNPMTEFLNECCVVRPGAEVAAQDLREAYNGWAAKSHLSTLTARELGLRLSEMGCESVRISRNGSKLRGWRGIGLLTASSEELPGLGPDGPDNDRLQGNSYEIPSRRTFTEKGTYPVQAVQPLGDPAPSNGNGNGHSASIPLLITRRMRLDLEYAGYAPSDIDRMTPEEAWRLLGGAA